MNRASTEVIREIEESRERYATDGCAFPIDVLSRAEAAQYRRRLEDMEARCGNLHYSPKPHLTFTFVDELIRDARVLDRVESILGPNLLVWDSTFIIKEAKDALEEAAALYREHDEPLPAGRTLGALVTTLWALGDPRRKPVMAEALALLEAAPRSRSASGRQPLMRSSRGFITSTEQCKSPSRRPTGRSSSRPRLASRSRDARSAPEGRRAARGASERACTTCVAHSSVLSRRATAVTPPSTTPTSHRSSSDVAS